MGASGPVWACFEACLDICTMTVIFSLVFVEI